MIDKQKQSRKSTKIRRQEIIDAGMHILTSEGARQFTAERLGAAVGITSGTIFRHFVSMDEILDSIVDRIEEIIFANFPHRADNPLESLHQFFEERVKAFTRHPEVSKLLLTSKLIPNDVSKNREKRLLEFKKRSKRFVTERLMQAKKEGLLADDISHEESCVLVLGAIYAIGHMGIGAKGASDKNELINRVWILLKRTLQNSNKENL